MRVPYTDNETALICAAYARLATAEQAGVPLNKAQLYRDLAPLTQGRTRGAIEAKWMNCSHVAVTLGLLPGLPNGHVTGYKPAPNAAKALTKALATAISVEANRLACADFDRLARSADATLPRGDA